MSYTQVITHLQSIMNQCGDPVVFRPTGQKVIAEPGQITIEINKVVIRKQNNCYLVLPPTPRCNDNPEDGYWVNRIRISLSLIDDYSKNFPLTDDELRGIISKKATLFGCY